MRVVTCGWVLIWTGISLGACGGGGPAVTTVPEDQARRVVSTDDPAVPLTAAGGVVTAEGTKRKPEDGPYIMELWLHPDPPLSYQALRAEPRIDNPAGGYLDVEYQWWVDGEEVMGVTGDTLPADEFGKGSVVEVEVVATDINKREDEHRFRDIRVANSRPVVTSRIGAAGSLDGYQFQAQDPDGDEVTWRLEGAPPGVSIGRTSGIMRIASGQGYGSGSYRISVIASDGEGGEGSLTFEAALSGGQRAKVVQEGGEQVVDAAEMKDEQYFSKAEELAKKVEEMSDEELDAALERSAISQEDLEAAGATEVGEDVTQRPAYLE